MTYSLVFIFIGYLIYAWWPDGKSVRSEEIKRLGRHGAMRVVYKNGRVQAVSFITGKGGYAITPERFESWDLHKTHGGHWVRKTYNSNGSISEVVDLMPTLNLPPPPMEPAQIPRRSYGQYL